MDFHELKRKQLQVQCKKHGVPANLTNREMADRLASIFKENEELVSQEEFSLEDSVEECNGKENPVKGKRAKKVTFSPENEVFEFTRSVKKRRVRSNQVGNQALVQNGPAAANGLRRSKRGGAKDNAAQVGAVGGDEPQMRGETEVTKQQLRRCAQDGLEVRKVLRRSKRGAADDSAQDEAVGIDVNEPYKAGKIRVTDWQSLGSAQNGVEEEKGLRRPKRFAATGRGNTQGGSLVINPNEPQVEDDNLQDEAFRANISESYIAGETLVTERKPRRSSGNGVEEGKGLRRSKRFAASGHTQGGSLGINANEPQVGADNLQDEAVRTNVGESYIAGETLATERQPRGSSGNGVQEGKGLRRSKRFAASDNAQGGSLDIYANEPQVKGETQLSKKQSRRCNPAGSEVEKVSKRSKQIAANDNAQDGAIRFNINEPSVACKNLVTESHLGPQVGNVSRRSKRFEANDHSNAGALGSNINELHDQGKAQGTEKQPRRSTQNGLVERKISRGSTCIAADDNVVGGAPENKIKEQRMKHNIQVTDKKYKKSTDNDLELGNVLRKSKTFAAKDVRGGALRVSADKQNMESETQAADKKSRMSTQDGHDVGKILRRSKRFAANDDEQGGAVKEPHMKAETRVPEKQLKRSIRAATRYNSGEASQAVDESSIGAKNTAVKPVMKVTAKAGRNRRYNKAKMQRVDEQAISTLSSPALEEPRAEYAWLEKETAGKSNEIEPSGSRVIAQTSHRKRKGSKRKYVKKKPRGSVEVPNASSGTDTLCSAVISEDISDPPQVNLAEVSDRPESQLIEVSESPESRHSASGSVSPNDEEKSLDGKDEDKCQRNNVIQAVAIVKVVEAEYSSQLSVELPVGVKSGTSHGFIASDNSGSFAFRDGNAGEQMKANSRSHSNVLKKSQSEKTTAPTVSKLLKETTCIAETETDTPNDYVTAKDIDCKVMTEEWFEKKKGPSVSVLQSDLNEHSYPDEAAGHGIWSISPSQEKLSSSDVKTTDGQQTKVYSNQDDGRNVLKNEIQTESLPQDATDGQDSDRERAEGKLASDIVGSRTSISKKTTGQYTLEPTSEELQDGLELQGERDGSIEGVVDMTCTEEYAKASNTDTANIGAKGMIEKSDFEPYGHEIMKVNLRSALKADHASEDDHGDLASNGEETETVGTNVDPLNCNEVSLMEMEKADQQPKNVGPVEPIASGCLVEREAKEILDAKTSCNIPPTMEIVAYEDAHMESISRREGEPSANRKSTGEINSPRRGKEVLINDRSSRLASSEVVSVYCEKLETPTKTRDTNLKAEETKFGDEGDKRGIVELSKSASAASSCPPSRDDEPVEEDNINASPRLTSDDTNELIVEELDKLKETDQSENSNDVDENEEAVENGVCAMAMDGKTGLENFCNSSKIVKRRPPSLDAVSEGDTGEPMQVVIASSEENINETASEEKENKVAKFHEESEIFTSPARNLMLGDDEIHEAGKAGGIFLAQSTQDCTYDAIKLKANATIRGELDCQIAEKMMGDGNGFSSILSEEPEVHDVPSSITPKGADGKSHKDDSSNNGNSCLFSPEVALTLDFTVVRSYFAPLEDLMEDKCLSVYSKVAGSSPNMEMAADENSLSKDVSGQKKPAEDRGRLAYSSVEVVHDLALTSNTVTWAASSDVMSEECKKLEEKSVEPRDTNLRFHNPKSTHETVDSCVGLEPNNIMNSYQNDLPDHVHENKDAVVEENSCVISLAENISSEDNTSVAKVAGNIVSVAPSEGYRSSLMHSYVIGTCADREEISVKDTENEPTEIHDEPAIFSSLERNVMLADNEPDEVGEPKDRSSTEPVMGDHDDEQIAQKLVGQKDLFSDLVSQGSDKHATVSAIISGYVDSGSLKVDSTYAENCCTFSLKSISAEDIMVARDYDGAIEKTAAECNTSDLIGAEYSPMVDKVYCCPKPEDRGDDISHELIDEVRVIDNTGGAKTDAENIEKSEDVKVLSPILDGDISGKESEGNFQLGVCGLRPLDETDALVENKKEVENLKVDSEVLIEKPRERSLDEFLDAKRTDPTSSIKSHAAFPLQMEAHGSMPLGISLVELSVRHDKIRQDGKAVADGANASTQESPTHKANGLHEFGDKELIMDAIKQGSHSSSVKPSDSLIIRTASRKPNLVHRTQVKPARHAMKENAPSSKIEQVLNVTAPRMSKRRPLEDLKKS